MLDRIRYECRIHNQPDFENSHRIKYFIVGLKRWRTSQISIKTHQTVTLPILKLLCDNAQFIIGTNFETKLLQAMFTMAFFGLLRKSEFSATSNTMSNHAILLNEIIIHYKYIQLTIHNAKTAAPGTAQTVLIGPKHFKYCPIKTLKKYLQVKTTKSGPLFTNLKGEPVTANYFTFRVEQILCFSKYPTELYSSHTFRICGVTYLFEKLLKKMRLKNKADGHLMHSYCTSIHQNHYPNLQPLHEWIHLKTST